MPLPTITIRLARPEYRALKVAVKTSGKTLSEYVRAALSEAWTPLLDKGARNEKATKKSGGKTRTPRSAGRKAGRVGGRDDRRLRRAPATPGRGRNTAAAAPGRADGEPVDSTTPVSTAADSAGDSEARSGRPAADGAARRRVDARNQRQARKAVRHATAHGNRLVATPEQVRAARADDAAADAAVRQAAADSLH